MPGLFRETIINCSGVGLTSTSARISIPKGVELLKRIAEGTGLEPAILSDGVLQDTTRALSLSLPLRIDQYKPGRAAVKVY